MLWVERTLAFDGLPKLIADVRDEELRRALEEHLGETREHASRVEEAFRAAGAEPTASRSAALAGALEQHNAQQVTEPGLRDLFHATGAIRTERFELGLYDALLLLADGDAATLLSRNRGEDAAARDRLSSIVERLRGQLAT